MHPSPLLWGFPLFSSQVGRWVRKQVVSSSVGHPLSLLLHRLLEGAMSGKYLHDGFTLPCPPGLKIPAENGYTITPNTLKVLGPYTSDRQECPAGVSPWWVKRGWEGRVAPLLVNSQRAFLVHVW